MRTEGLDKKWLVENSFQKKTSRQPSSGDQRAMPARQWSIPGQDHARAWYDPVTRRYLIADEPYQRELQKAMPKRTAWLEEFGYVMQLPDWPGMYNPYMDLVNGSRLCLVTHASKGVDLERVVAALYCLTPPLGSGPWGGISEEQVPLAGSRLARLSALGSHA
ncbi:MAG: hypothetical protein Q8K71_00895 [Polaromonas sp.]|nr:hypothetical protein [Polaromonas sp.]